MDYIGESQNPARRKWRKGHKSEKVDIDERTGYFRVVCRGEGCNWFTVGNLAWPEPAEEATYAHISEPDLLVPGSSDVLLPTRLETMHALASKRG